MASEAKRQRRLAAEEQGRSEARRHLAACGSLDAALIETIRCCLAWHNSEWDSGEERAKEILLAIAGVQKLGLSPHDAQMNAKKTVSLLPSDELVKTSI